MNDVGWRIVSGRCRWKLNSRGLWNLLFSVFVAFCLSCASSAVGVAADDLIVPPEAPLEWESWRPGVDLADIHLAHPPLRGWIARIDLGHPSVEVFTTPAVDGAHETSLATTKDAAERHGWDLAVNASPFSRRGSLEENRANIEGWAVSNFQEYSSPAEGRPVFALSLSPHGETRGSLGSIPHQRNFVKEAAGGFFMILRNGQTTGPRSERFPVTAVGLSDEGRLLYLMVVDGRQPSRSVGLTPWEAGSFLAYAGADEGMLLDGGGSSTFVSRHQNGRLRVLNRPVDNRLLGRQRPVANHIGLVVQDG